MKKYLIVLLIAAAFAFVSCEKAPEVSIDKDIIEMDYRGGTLDFSVTSNCDWEIICDSDDVDLLTVSQWTGGPGTQTITVTVDSNHSNSILKHFFTAVAHGSIKDDLQYVTVIQGAPAYVIFNKNAFSTDYIGGEFKFTVSSNFPWEIEVIGDGVTVEPLSGIPTPEEDDDVPSPAEEDGEEDEADNVITVTVDEYEGDAPRSFILNVVAHGDEGDVSDQLVITQSNPSLKIGSRNYRIKKMGDGRWWMVDNLCFSTKGITIGDGQCGIWYPCSDDSNTPDLDENEIVRKGLLYSDAAAFSTNITATTAKKQEDTPQGLCPDGWHIPTLGEWMALVGKFDAGDRTVSEDDEPRIATNTEAPYYDASQDCGSLTMLKAAGFINNEAGYIQGDGVNFSEGASVKGYVARQGKVINTYFFCSSHFTEKVGDKVYGYWYILKTNERANTANVESMDDSLSETPYGGSVRCIKDNLTE